MEPESTPSTSPAQEKASETQQGPGDYEADLIEGARRDCRRFQALLEDLGDE